MLAATRLVIAESERHPKLAKLYYDSGTQRLVSMLADFLDRQNGQGTIRIPNTLSAASYFLSILKGQYYLRMILRVKPLPEQKAKQEHVRECAWSYSCGSMAVATPLSLAAYFDYICAHAENTDLYHCHRRVRGVPRVLLAGFAAQCAYSAQQLYHSQEYRLRQRPAPEARCLCAKRPYKTRPCDHIFLWRQLAEAAARTIISSRGRHSPPGDISPCLLITASIRRFSSRNF